ncbi:autotransporter adhesin [[Pasteurella] mairii]|uniref:Autotransporter adhesin n=1 Tax=[Pasteurella] mairii TaxID=757 RepID=A0A379B7Y0_9PAST|nr:autotransporter adhesin [[Pasteurella] mairii]
MLTANEAFADQNVYSWTDNGVFKISEWRKDANVGSGAVHLSNQWNAKKHSDYVLIGKSASVGVISQTNSGMVAIGTGSHAAGDRTIAIGEKAKTKEGMGQAIAIGNNAGANSQSVALGADVFAHGKSSVAIGNDDIDDAKFNDMLPEETIREIYKSLINDNSYFGNNLFDQKYIQKKGDKDNRIYSPTYAAGIGAIAIGSRAVAAGNLSTSVGALSFALADHSTTLGMRAFVGQSATGGVAVGQESRVFAPNSLAIGNFNEATSKGAMSYGFNARAVGENTIAIGSMVGAGAKFNKEAGDKWLKLYRDFNKNSAELDDNKEFDEKATTILKNGNSNETMPLGYQNDVMLTIGDKDIKKTQLHGENEHGKNAIVIGGRSFALWENSLALGYSALADASNGFAIGSYAYAGNRATNAMAIGVRSYAEGVNSIALGYRARVQDESKNTEFLKSISADKNQDSYKGTNSIALGIESLAYLNNSVALGHKSQTDYLYADLLHKPYTPKGAITLPTSAQAGVISVGSKGSERRVVNVASGYLDTDAANVGQLKSLEERVNLLTSGGAGINAPYLAVDQTSASSEAKRITDGQKAVQTYERYVELARQYANLLNRKVNGKETFNDEALKEIKAEVDKLGSTNDIKNTASEITKIIEELDKLQAGVRSSTSEEDLKKKFGEFQTKIDTAVKTDSGDEKKSQLTKLTDQEIKESNFNSNRAEGQDSIAFGFKAHTTTDAKHAIAIGYNATAQADGAVAIGDTAMVEKNAGDSVALGKGSKATEKKTALSSATIPAGNGKGIQFSWTGAGTSNNSDTKPVVSVGAQGSERVITHVAAGNVTATSTDAINGGQLYGVASVFSNMATGILGLEANNGQDGFKNANFSKLKDENGQNGDGTQQKTFKTAIDENIKTINKGLKFAGDKGSEFTRQLGATVKIKGDGTDLISTANSTSGEISFKLEKETNLETGSKKVPTTEAVKTYLDNKIQGISSTLGLEADNSKDTTYGEVALKTQKLKVKGTDGDIKTSVSSNTITISLDEKFKTKVSSIETNVTKNTSDIKTVTDKVTKNIADIKTVTDKATQNENKIKEVDAKADKNAEDIKNQEIAYKANGAQKLQKVKLSEGLDFNGDTNIAVKAEANGKITHSLNTALKGIKSITNATDDNGNGAKITLDNDKITVNKKITGLEDGDISEKSTDAVTGKQLHSKLEEKANRKLDNLDQDGKDVISKQAVQAINATTKEGNSSALTVEDKTSEDGKSKTIKVGLDESTLITNLSSGANISKPAENSPKLVTDKQVSEFIGGKKLIFTDSKNSRHENKLDSEFKLVGNSDITVSVSKDGENGNGQATFVLNKATEINENTLLTNGNKDKAATAGAVKTYVDNALTTAKTEADKTAVKYDDDSKNAITLGGKDTSHSPVEINNLRSGLGIDEINDSGIASATQGKTNDLVKKLVAGELDQKSSHKAVNVSDLKAVATAGLNFAGNDSDHLIHKNLGETLEIVGKGVKKEQVAAFNGTDNNILVKTVDNKRLEIALNAQLTGLQSATFTKDQKTVEITGDKIVLKDKADNGNSATYTADSATLKDENGNTAQLNGQGLTVGDKNSDADKTHTVYGKDGLTISGKDGKNAVSLTTKNENGKDAATLEFAKDKDGKAGTGAITGLKDLADNADGSSATNKNYVDNQLKKAKEDADKTAVKYDDDKKDAITLGGKGTSHKPVVIDNLRSGLGIDDIKDGGIASIKQGLTRDLVKKLVAGELDKDFSHKAANVSDLKALATAGLNFAGNDAKDIHKNLGETLAIVGQGVTDIALFKGTNNNIAVKTVAGNLEVSLNEALSAIKSLVTQTKSLEGNADLSAISTLDGAGLHLTPVTKDGNAPQKQADYGLLGSTLKDGEKTNTQTAGSITLALGEKSNTQTAESNTLQAKDAEDPTTTLTNKQTAAGNQISDNKGNSATYDRHGVSLQDQDKNSANLNAKGLTVGDDKGEDKTHATYGKNGLTIHGKDGQSAVSLTTENTHGKEAATLEFAKGEDGKAGTGAITGLKDLEASSDGSSAANKNYVDAQLSSALEEVAGNRPFDYYLNDIKVSKDKDGNFYKEEGGKKVKLTDVEKAQVVIKAEPQSTPMTVSNIKAAKLAENSTDAVNGAQLVAATGALAGQDGKMTFADGRDGKAATDPTAAANQGLTAKDGLNGHNANDKANALRNGEAGTVVYTDSAGQRLVKANDSKYYHAADVGRDGKPQGGKSAVENPQLSLVNAQGNTNNAALLGNVASGLGIKEPSSEEKQKIAALADVIKAKAGDVSTKAEAVSAKADVLSSLSDVVNAKEDAINAEKLAIAALPDGDDKTKAQTALKAKEVALETEKAKLATAKSELDKAKQNLSNAKAGLKVANDTYREALASVNNKIADLVNANSRATLTNAATVADLQAVARAGLNVVGNDGLTVHKHLGETLSITGEGEFNSDTSAAGNIKVELAQDGQGLSVKLSDKLQGMTSVETREIHGKKSLLDSNGLKTVSADSETRVSAQGTEIVGKGANAGKAAGYRLDGVRLQDGVNHATLSAQQGLRLTGQAGEPSLIATKNGLVVKGAQGDIALDGQRGEILLPNVKPDASGYVAVNKNYVDSQNNELRTQLSNTNREMRAGIAGALAAASLPSSAIPGKSMLAASAGAFKGHSAIALGYSKMSDNGKISIRLQGTSNSAGDLGGAVGVGYLW